MSIIKLKKEKQKNLKVLSKVIEIIAKIGKVLVTICIPIVIIAALFVPYLLNNITVGDNSISFGEMNIVEDTVNNSTFIKIGNTIIAEENEDINAIMQLKEILDNNSKSKMIGCSIIGFIFIIADLFVIRMILKHIEDLFTNINKIDTPFTMENVEHIKKMAYLMIISIILPIISDGLFATITKSNWNLDIELFSIVEILILFAASYIFEYGYSIQSETDAKIYGEESQSGENVEEK